jgi:hypothetical protein
MEYDRDDLLGVVCVCLPCCRACIAILKHGQCASASTITLPPSTPLPRKQYFCDDPPIIGILEDTSASIAIPPCAWQQKPRETTGEGQQRRPESDSSHLVISYWSSVVAIYIIFFGCRQRTKKIGWWRLLLTGPVETTSNWHVVLKGR